MSNFVKSAKDFASIIWQDFINLIHLTDGLPKDSKERGLVKTLREDGIIFLENFLEKKKCDDLAEKLLEITEGRDKSVELESGTVLNIRNAGNEGGSDHGMIDIFYVDQEIPEIKKIDVRFVEELLYQAHQQEVVKLKTHAYVNKGVQGTRGFHIDNTQPVIYKAFVYLTDVPDESYGPYSFVKGTQRLSRQVYKNLLGSFVKPRPQQRDMPHVNENRIVNCTAPKGTMILSNQNGIHRGLPQDPDKSRIALVFYFTILSKLSYLHKSARQKLKQAQES